MLVEDFIKCAREVHGDKYDYSKVTFIKTKVKKVTIICPIHGEFLQAVNVHLNGSGCPKCKGVQKKTTEDFVKQAKEIYPEYDYSKVEYKNATTKVLITCPKHGDFLAIPRNTLSNHAGCPQCGLERQAKCFARTDKQFKELALKVRPNYDFSQSYYQNQYKKIRVTCDFGHNFEIIPKSLLQGYGCPECSAINIRKRNKEAFIEKAKNIHGDKYDYSTLEYTRIDEPMSIICPEHGRVYMWPSSHLKGNGCPKCSQSIGEYKVEEYLKKLGINYKREYSIEYFGNKSGKTYIDFYLPDLNSFIEYNGRQHYIPCDYFGGQLIFDKQVKRDKYVEEYCKKNGITLITIKYNEDINEILNNQIKKYV